jgi:hypothetical protein
MITKFNDVYFLSNHTVSNYNDTELNLNNYYKKWRWLKISKEYRKDISNGYVYVEKKSWFKKLSMAYIYLWKTLIARIQYNRMECNPWVQNTVSPT